MSVKVHSDQDFQSATRLLALPYPRSETEPVRKTDLFSAFTVDPYFAASRVAGWTLRSAAEANAWAGIAWSPQLGLFAAVSYGGTNRVMTSPDGATWTARSAAAANTWTSIAWSPKLGLFVAVSYDGSSRVMSSPDGITWTSRTAAENNQWNSVTWSPTANGTGMFVAVSDNGTNRVMTSTNGTSWTARAAAEANQWYAVVWSPELSLFAAVSANGTNRVMTSSDGATWTARSAAAANTWYAIAWSPTANGTGLFAAVSGDGTNRVMTSPDGTTWTSRSASEANAWNAIAWSPKLNLFVAVSADGTNRAMSSPDGMTWTARAATGSYVWYDLAWSPELGLFAAVANSGANQVMTNLPAEIPVLATSLIDGLMPKADKAKLDKYQVHGPDIASATTTVLDSATGEIVDVTGTTTITAITLADGVGRIVRFTGALTLTHGSSLVLPGAANIATAAGDFAIFRGYAAGVVRCVDYIKASGRPLVIPCVIQVACSDTSTAITAGTGKATFRMPFAMTLTEVRASVSTAPTGSTILIDLNEGGTTVLSTKLMIAVSEKTSTTAATAAVISDAALADDAEMTVDFDQVGSTVAGAGVVVTLIGTRAA